MFEKNLNIGFLLDFYGDVLTERKRDALDFYYKNDMSLSEVAEELGISRQGARELIKKAEAIRKKVIELSFDGEKFLDHSVRNSEGVLENQPHVSAAAQYYAALFGGIDLYNDKYSKLLRHIKEDFANLDKRDIDFVPVNAFVGFYLRMELLMRLGEKTLLEANVKEFFAETVKYTDTLWENRDRFGSFDHGFSSYVVLAINSIIK